MKIKYLPLLLGTLLFSCQSNPNQLGLAAEFFPPSKQFQKGFACKYYKHQHPNDKGKVSSTNIEYRTWQLVSPDKIIEDFYDAAFHLKTHTLHHMEGGKMEITEHFQIYRGDTTHATILPNSTHLDWNGKEASYGLNLDFEDLIKIDRKQHQISMQDTLVENISCKKFKKTGELLRIFPKGDSTMLPSTSSIIYAKDIGLYAVHLKKEESTYHTELIEQMTLDEFKKRANHGKKRIAYIDPDNTIDQSPDFKICDKELFIGDYYNGELRGELKGGKGSWWRILKKGLDHQKLKKESGFLTYRFLLNCKGETARFITEQADLDFQPKQFPAETIEHFYELISSQKDWQPCQKNDDTYDSYTYITFKLKNGKVIEILP